MVPPAAQTLVRSGQDTDDNDQLLKLFWNRAELKKEFDKLNARAAELESRLKQRDTVLLRVQQRLEQLEVQLGNPATSDRVVTYYFLQGVWTHCHDRLKGFSKELVRKHSELTRLKQVGEFQRQLRKTLDPLNAALETLQQESSTLTTEIERLGEEHARLSGFWWFLRRRRLARELERKSAERKALRARISALSEEIGEHRQQAMPDTPELDLRTRRLINLGILALAQELYLHFEKDRLAEMARETQSRDCGDIRYGNHRDCREIRHRITRRLEELDADQALHKRVAQRTRFLGTQVEFRADEDTVPAAASVNRTVRLGPDGRPLTALSVNVLGDEYWNVFSVLLS